MKYRVLCEDTIIGESDFEGLDPAMGVAQGVFVPTPAYKEVQPVFLLYVEAGFNILDQDDARLNEYYRARDALGLSIVTAAGEHVPTDCIHITDYSQDIGEIEVAIIAADGAAFQRYFERR